MVGMVATYWEFAEAAAAAVLSLVHARVTAH